MVVRVRLELERRIELLLTHLRTPSSVFSFLFIIFILSTYGARRLKMNVNPI